MQLTLTYEGRLGSNARPVEKHRLRQHFHRQLKALWSLKPLSGYSSWIKIPADDAAFTILREIHGFHFAPLVSVNVQAVAELEVRLLWPQTAGSIFVNGGDIDNRLKTLFDALKVPSEPTALPPDTRPEMDETPFFCLLEDDSLITRVTVDTDRLLESGPDPLAVKLTVRVVTRNIGSQWKQLP